MRYSNFSLVKLNLNVYLLVSGCSYQANDDDNNNNKKRKERS